MERSLIEWFCLGGDNGTRHGPLCATTKGSTTTYNPLEGALRLQIPNNQYCKEWTAVFFESVPAGSFGPPFGTALGPELGQKQQPERLSHPGRKGLGW